MSLPRLTALAGILRERELARLSAAARRAAALRHRLAGLDLDVQARAEVLGALADAGGKAPEPALAGGAEGRWLLWLGRERQALQSRYLLQLAELEELRAGAARAFGRAEVLRALSEAQRTTARQARARRSGTGGPP